jgi:DNA-binding response OmpR family regulator
MNSLVSQPTSDSKPVVLVIDDDVLSLELYTRELSSNYQVIACEHFEQVHHHLHNQPLAAVILEPAMNDDYGWTLLKEIRSISILLPVILCSVLDERKAGLEQGADVFLVKPVLPTKLHILIDQIVSQRQP